MFGRWRRRPRRPRLQSLNPLLGYAHAESGPPTGHFYAFYYLFLVLGFLFSNLTVLGQKDTFFQHCFIKK